ncbi:hypothetical protein [Dyella silvatica]|uniref:hypothetical protein n=1 Tax=Dyella silvatica TaxID=2992128 RepID=UPI002252DDDB|nr:hypothetical protein [Dyella silvatica]
MAFFEVADDRLSRLLPTSLADAQIRERRDLQRLLRAHLNQLLPDLLVISEEFGDWDDSKRRVDLLAVDRMGNLVVIELKRGDTGHHMDLQSIRYAAMVSTMTFAQAVDAYRIFLGPSAGASAQDMLLEFLRWSEPNEDDFAQDVRIILFSEDFSRELTSSVLWLRDKRVDITCFRVNAYQVSDRLLLDFNQIIPLREAEEFQVKVRDKQLVENEARRERVPWNGEFYANYGNDTARSWEDACKYGFISAGGGHWFTRTLNLLTPSARVWINRPGVGYLGVGVVTGEPTSALDFMVDTKQGRRRYIDLDTVNEVIRGHADSTETMEVFVPIKWLATVPETKAIREPGLFGNQNSVAKPTVVSWPHTIERLMDAFGLVG